jgi:hypothetical protein
MTVPLPFIPLTTTSKVVPLFGAISVMVTVCVPGVVKVVGLSVGSIGSAQLSFM